MEWSYCHLSDFSDDEYELTYSRLSETRKLRVDRYKRQDDKKRSLAGEILVNKLLLEKFKTNAILNVGENGRPFLSDTKYSVSIAHCSDIAVCAVSEIPVGIDIEQIKDISYSLINRVCVEDELNYVLQESDARKDDRKITDKNVLERFFEIWTGKEAWFKKIGTGITDLKSVNVLNLERKVFAIDDYIITIVV